MVYSYFGTLIVAIHLHSEQSSSRFTSNYTNHFSPFYQQAHASDSSRIRGRCCTSVAERMGTETATIALDASRCRAGHCPSSWQTPHETLGELPNLAQYLSSWNIQTETHHFQCATGRIIGDKPFFPTSSDILGTWHAAIIRAMDVEDAGPILDVLDSICYTPSHFSDDATEPQGQSINLDSNTNAEGNQIPALSSGYDTEIITDALLREWEEETANFRDFMHEISEDSPQRWTRPRRLTQMVQILVCIRPCTALGVPLIYRLQETLTSLHEATEHFLHDPVFVAAGVEEMGIWIDFMEKVKGSSGETGAFLHSLFVSFCLKCVIPA